MMMRAALALVAVVLVAPPAFAEPLPVAHIGKRCPVGYTDRDGVCVPMLGQRCCVSAT